MYHTIVEHSMKVTLKIKTFFKVLRRFFEDPSQILTNMAFKIRSEPKQFHCLQCPHVMEFLLTEKDLSLPREKPCQTD
jgi:hypothetical protein